MSSELVAEAGAAKGIELGLKAEQVSALRELAQGKSIAETARAAGVSRPTVYSWLKSDPAFRAAYNRWHEEMEESTRSQLLMCGDLATGAIKTALENGDAKTALALLKGLGLIKPSGERLTEAADVKKRAELDALKLKIGMEEEGRKLVSEAKIARGTDRMLEEAFRE
jgi:transposase-like protein